MSIIQSDCPRLHQSLLRRRFYTCSFVAACLALFVGCGEAPYRAEARLRVEDYGSYLIYPDVRPAEATPAAFFHKQRRLLLSPLVLEQVLARTDVASLPSIANAARPVELLRERLELEQSENSEVWTLSCQWSDPVEAALIANAVVEAYFRMYTQDEAQRSTRLIELLEDERARRMVVVQQLIDQIKGIEKRTKVSFSRDLRALREQALRDSYLRLHGQYDEVALQLAEMKVADQESRLAEPAGDLKVAIEPELPASAECTALELRMKAIEAREAEVLTRLDALASPDAVENSCQLKQRELEREQEVVDEISTRIMKLRTEMVMPAKVTLVRRAEPPVD